MPIVGFLIGPRGFENSYISLSKDVDEAKSVHPNLSLEDARKIGNVLAWGDFVSILIDFLIIAVFIFLLIKFLNRLRLSRGVTAVIEGIKKD